MTSPAAYHTNDRGEQRLRRLEHQVEVLAAALVNLTSAVEALAFASADPHAAVAIRRAHQLLDSISASPATHQVTALKR